MTEILRHDYADTGGVHQYPLYAHYVPLADSHLTFFFKTVD